MGKYPLSPSEKARFDGIWREMSGARKAEAVLDYDHFCKWLRGEDSSFYSAIKDKLYELWENIKKTVGDIAEGFATGIGVTVVTPIYGIVEGVKEGFNNGLEAGVKRTFSAMGEILDDILG